jgi:hypothetical protein
MVARTKRPRRPASLPRKPASGPLDAVALFAEKMRAIHERDRALDAVVRWRDDGQIRKAHAELARAERLHARIDAIDRAFAAPRPASC